MEVEFMLRIWRSIPHLLGKGLSPIQRFYIILWVVCCVVYLLNKRTIGTGDTIGNTLIVFNLLENHSLYFDSFILPQTNPSNYYWFAQNNHGHLVSTYPIGVAIVTAPLYFIFYVYLKISQGGAPLDLASTSFEATRLLFERIAATIVVATSVTLFFALLRRQFNNQVALITTLIFAFATNVWATSSQLLWQHGVLNLVTIAMMWQFFLAQQANPDKQQIRHLFLAGIFCWLVPGIRPNALPYSLAGTVYAITSWRRRSLSFLLGIISIVPSLAWNFYNFGNAVGGYSNVKSPYGLENFSTASLALLFSPSRGLFVYTPILLFAIPGCWILLRLRQKSSLDWLSLNMLVASFGIMLSYCFFFMWWAGYSYGPRFMVDVLPILCLMIAYWLCQLLKRKHWQNYRAQFYSALFCITAAYSSVVQLLGVLNLPGANSWDIIPVPINRLHRAWDWQDTPITRQWRNLHNYALSKKITKLIKPRSSTGQLVNLVQTDPKTKIHDLAPIPRLKESFKGTLQGKAGSESVLQLLIRNSNNWNWYGYDQGMFLGEQVVSGTIYDRNQVAVGTAEFTVASTIKPQEAGLAVGLLIFPTQPGEYTIRLDLTIRGIDAQVFHIQEKIAPLAVVPLVVHP